MSVEKPILDALAGAVAALNNQPSKAIPASVINTLAPIAKPGVHLKLDLVASKTIGAPLITAFNNNQSNALLSTLTPRQKQVAKLVIDGLSNKQIAEKLHISIATVKDHVHAILSRLNLDSRRALMLASRS